MSELRTVESTMEECTHNCSTCGLGCESGERADKMTLEQTLYSVSDVDSAALLKALQEF
jgi:hypothetical protein